MDKQQLEKLINELVKLPIETEWVEFKLNNENPERLGQIISALSNSAALHGCERAYIIFGVDNTLHNIIGTTFRPRLTKKGNEELESWLSHKLVPRIHFQILEHFSNGRNVVIFEIYPTVDRPVCFDGKAYIRVGSYTKLLKEYPEKERQIWNNPRHRTFEREAAMSNLEPDTVLTLIDYPAYFELTEQPLPNSRDGILEKLAQDKLITGDQNGQYVITNLGAILFARQFKSFDSINLTHDLTVGVFK